MFVSGCANSPGGNMSKLNKNATHPTQINSREYKHTEIQELTERVLTAFFGEEKHGESSDSSTDAIINLTRKLGKTQPLFVAKLAILAREKFNLRTVPQVIAAELSRVHKGDSMVSALLARVIQRPDEMTDIISYLSTVDGKTIVNESGRKRKINKKIPNQVRKGIDIAFRKFSEYQLAKYSGKNKNVKLRDVLNLVHPTPSNPEQADLWKRLIEGNLKTPETWETSISAAGKSDDDVDDAKKMAWENLIVTKKLGYMAALRNIRNIIEANVSPEAHKMLQDYLSNENAVVNSKQLPFRFWSAYKIVNSLSCSDELKNAYKRALNRAIFHSGKNFPRLHGNTVLVTDLSGSMQDKLSSDSDVSYMDVGAVLTAISVQFCDSVLALAFGEKVAQLNMDFSPDNTLDTVAKIKDVQRIVGHSTNAHLVMDSLIKNNVKADNIIFFTDCNFNGGSYTYAEKKYREQINNDVYIYSVNLSGRGITQHDPLNPRNVFMSGWSENLLKFIAEYQEYRNGIVDMVNEVIFKF